MTIENSITINKDSKIAKLFDRYISIYDFLDVRTPYRSKVFTKNATTCSIAWWFFSRAFVLLFHALLIVLFVLCLFGIVSIVVLSVFNVFTYSLFDFSVLTGNYGDWGFFTEVYEKQERRTDQAMINFACVGISVGVLYTILYMIGLITAATNGFGKVVAWFKSSKLYTTICKPVVYDWDSKW